MQVLLHGCILSEQNIDTVLDGIHRDLEKIETSLANSLLDVIPGHRDVSFVLCPCHQYFLGLHFCSFDILIYFVVINTVSLNFMCKLFLSLIVSCSICVQCAYNVYR